MQVEIITIGNELLIGQVVDTNSAWMGKKLNNAGFDIVRITSIQDTEQAILNTLKEAQERVDIVLLTGGLGPTKDDITKATLAKYFNSQLVFNELVFEDVKRFLKGRVKNINKLNEGQAYVPECCEVISNHVGTAPIMWFEQEGKVVVSMPGVPPEMKLAMEREVVPRLEKRFVTQKIIHKTIQIANIPEAVLAEMLEPWEHQIPEYISLAYLPSPGKIRLRLTAKTNNEIGALSEIEKLIKQLYEIVGDNIFSEEDKPAQVLLSDLLRENGKTLAVAESCTGGNIGHLITSIPGSSAIFKGGVIAYENSIKEQVLKVDKKDLLSHGAVSKPVVEQMAKGVRELMQSDYAIATSGIAGPDGGTEEKPVGTVWIAVAGNFGVRSECFNFGRFRDRNIQRSSDMGLIMLLKELKK